MTADEWPLAGLARCGVCGVRLRPDTVACQPRCYRCDCPAIIDAAELDDAVATAVLDRLSTRTRDLITPRLLRAGWAQATPGIRTAMAAIEFAVITVMPTPQGFQLFIVESTDLDDASPVPVWPASGPPRERAGGTVP